MLSAIQRLGGAMFTPVLLFPFVGILVGLTIVLKNPIFVAISPIKTVCTIKFCKSLKKVAGLSSAIWHFCLQWACQSVLQKRLTLELLWS